MFRIISNVLMSGLAIVFAFGMTASANAQDGGTWQYRTNTFTGKFIEEGDGKWTERVSTGAVYRFTEVERSTESIEIYDASRKLSIRLYDRSCEIRHAGTGGRWEFLYRGRFVYAQPNP